MASEGTSDLTPFLTQPVWGWKEKEREKREEGKRELLEREALPSLYIFRRSDQRFQAEQEEEFILAARASHQDQS